MLEKKVIYTKQLALVYYEVVLITLRPDGAGNIARIKIDL